ncbi:MAG: tetratricopeptide repeat protein [Bacillota bacterium]
MALSYKDFVVVCRKCEEVAWLSEKKCVRCGTEGHLISLDKSIKEAGKVSRAVSVIGGVIAVFGLLSVPFFGIMPGLIIYGVSSSITSKTRKAKEVRLREKSEQMFRSLEVSEVYHGIDETADGGKSFEEGNCIQAVNYFKSARERGYTTQETGLKLANDYYEMGEYSKAISLLERLNLKWPQLNGASELLAQAYLSSGELNAERISYVLKIRESTNKDIRDQLTLSLADYYCNQDINYFKEYIDKIAILKEAIALKPDNSTYVEAGAKLMMELGDMETVVEYCSKLDAKNHTESITMMYAKALCKLDDMSERAIPVYKKALSIHQTDGAIHLKLCEALLINGKYNEAIDLCKSGLDKEPNNPSLRKILALAYMKIGHLDQAITQLQSIREEDNFQSLCS